MSHGRSRRQRVLVPVDPVATTASRSLVFAGQRQLVSTWQEAVAREECSPALGQWVRWLTLSKTPDYTPTSMPLDVLHVRRGEIEDPVLWPQGVEPRVYVAFDGREAVYVGQTGRPLLHRIRQHYGNQSTADQREKAGTWEFITSVAFSGLRHGQLGELEASAARWVLPAHRRAGRQHPRTG